MMDPVAGLDPGGAATTMAAEVINSPQRRLDLNLPTDELQTKSGVAQLPLDAVRGTPDAAHGPSDAEQGPTDAAGPSDAAQVPSDNVRLLDAAHRPSVQAADACQVKVEASEAKQQTELTEKHHDASSQQPVESEKHEQDRGSNAPSVADVCQMKFEASEEKQQTDLDENYHQRYLQQREASEKHDQDQGSKAPEETEQNPEAPENPVQESKPTEKPDQGPEAPEEPDHDFDTASRRNQQPHASVKPTAQLEAAEPTAVADSPAEMSNQQSDSIDKPIAAKPAEHLEAAERTAAANTPAQHPDAAETSNQRPDSIDKPTAEKPMEQPATPLDEVGRNSSQTEADGEPAQHVDAAEQSAEEADTPTEQFVAPDMSLQPSDTTAKKSQQMEADVNPARHMNADQIVGHADKPTEQSESPDKPAGPGEAVDTLSEQPIAAEPTEPAEKPGGARRGRGGRRGGGKGDGGSESGMSAEGEGETEVESKAKGAGGGVGGAGGEEGEGEGKSLVLERISEWEERIMEVEEEEQEEEEVRRAKERAKARAEEKAKQERKDKGKEKALSLEKARSPKAGRKGGGRGKHGRASEEEGSVAGGGGEEEEGKGIEYGRGEGETSKRKGSKEGRKEGGVEERGEGAGGEREGGRRKEGQVNVYVRRRKRAGGVGEGQTTPSGSNLDAAMCYETSKAVISQEAGSGGGVKDADAAQVIREGGEGGVEAEAGVSGGVVGEEKELEGAEAAGAAVGCDEQLEERGEEEVVPGQGGTFGEVERERREKVARETEEREKEGREKEEGEKEEAMREELERGRREKEARENKAREAREKEAREKEEAMREELEKERREKEAAMRELQRMRAEMKWQMELMQQQVVRARRFSSYKNSVRAAMAMAAQLRHTSRTKVARAKALAEARSRTRAFKLPAAEEAGGSGRKKRSPSKQRKEMEALQVSERGGVGEERRGWDIVMDEGEEKGKRAGVERGRKIQAEGRKQKEDFSEEEGEEEGDSPWEEGPEWEERGGDEEREEGEEEEGEEGEESGEEGIPLTRSVQREASFKSWVKADTKSSGGIAKADSRLSGGTAAYSGGGLKGSVQGVGCAGKGVEEEGEVDLRQVNLAGALDRAWEQEEGEKEEGEEMAREQRRKKRGRGGDEVEEGRREEAREDGGEERGESDSGSSSEEGGSAASMRGSSDSPGSDGGEGFSFDDVVTRAGILQDGGVKRVGVGARVEGESDQARMRERDGGGGVNEGLDVEIKGAAGGGLGEEGEERGVEVEGGDEREEGEIFPGRNRFVSFAMGFFLVLLVLLVLPPNPSRVATVAAVPLRDFRGSRRIGVTTRASEVEVLAPAGDGSGNASSNTPLPMAGIFGDLQSPAASSYSMFVQAMASLQPPMDYAAFLNGAVGMANGITILAPSNAAFQVLGPYTSCLANYSRSGPMLATLLNHHILYGNFPESALFDGQRYFTLANTNVLVTRTATGLTVDGAKVVEPNKFAGYNGVVHGIDRVLFPPGITPSLYTICNQTGQGLAV
ncbi:unnamed protein product [Closterium sp. Yama58-4]|nr:unnamed protein product [Closterium sp. Yama58-4]